MGSRRSVADRVQDDYDELGEDEESDADDFIVDDDGQPITTKKKKAKRIFNDASLQEGSLGFLSIFYSINFFYGKIFINFHSNVNESHRSRYLRC